MNYLVLHFDMDFIVGAVCANNETVFPIKNGNDDALWLYFFNDTAQNKVSFGKSYQTHFNNNSDNYYGNFFEKIENKQETFELRGISHPVIDLLQESGLLKTLKDAYFKATSARPEKIPTLLTFSSSIGDHAKQKTVAYLKEYNFQINDRSVPLAELAGYYALHNYHLFKENESVAILLEATNSTLHLKKISKLGNFFKVDEQIKETYKGKGYDTRKQALLRFVVSEVSRSTYQIKNEEELLAECKRLEPKSDEWLRNIDSMRHNVPYNIQGVFLSKMPSATRNVPVTKANLDADTTHYVRGLKDIYDAFKDDYVQGDAVAVILLGDCFQSELVKNAFKKIYSDDKLFFYANNKIHDILAMYPKILGNVSTTSAPEPQPPIIVDDEEKTKAKISQLLSESKSLIEQGNLVQARKKLNEIRSIDQENSEEKFLLSKIEKCEEFLTDADKLYNEKKWEKAKRQYERALKICPHDYRIDDKMEVCKDEIEKIHDPKIEKPNIPQNTETTPQKNTFRNICIFAAIAACACIVVFLIVRYGGSKTGGNDTIKVTIAPNNPSVQIGKTVTLEAKTDPPQNLSWNWTSDKKNIATVDNGIVTGVSPGIATINATTTASNGRSISATTQVTVFKDLEPPTAWIAPNNSSVQIDKTVRLEVKTNPPQNLSWNWTSSNENIATVNNGTVTGKSRGTVTITATASNGRSISATTQVTVFKDLEPPTAWIAPNNSSVQIDKTVRLEVKTNPSQNLSWSWTSSDGSIATVNNGIVTGVSLGNATITATASNDRSISATAQVTVVPDTAKAKIQFEAGNRLVENGDCAGAHRYFAEAVRLNPQEISYKIAVTENERCAKQQQHIAAAENALSSGKINNSSELLQKAIDEISKARSLGEMQKKMNDRAQEIRSEATWRLNNLPK